VPRSNSSSPTRPPGPGHPGQLGHRPGGIGDMLEESLGPAGVEAGVGERQGGHVPALEAGAMGQGGSAAPGGVQHGLAGVDPHGPAAGGDPGGQVGGVLAVAAAGVKHPLAGAQAELLQQHRLGGPQAGEGVGHLQVPDQSAGVGGVDGLELADGHLGGGHRSPSVVLAGRTLAV
jgi:hypothetical protein